MRCRLLRRLPSSAGFSLVEMIITVAVMAILVGISSPAIYQFLRQKDDQVEENTMVEIHKAIEAYIADKGSLPDDGTQTPSTNLWYNKLAGYSRLSAQEIASDTWGRDRQYVKLTVNRPIYGQSISVTYVSVHSEGADGIAVQSPTPLKGIWVNSGNFVLPDSTTSTDKWWRQNATNLQLDAFSTMRPGGDDHLTRFTNYTEVMDNYKTTMQRLDKISQALEVYARSAYARRVSECTVASPPAKCAGNIPEKTIYYPCAIPASGPSTDVTTQCGQTAGANQYLFNENTAVVDNSASDMDRYDDMVQLMQVLGLPAEYCCSALESFTYNSNNYPKPFYYFPNPRQRPASGICNTGANHPNMTPGNTPPTDTKLPARLTTSNRPDVCG